SCVTPAFLSMMDAVSRLKLKRNLSGAEGSGRHQQGDAQASQVRRIIQRQRDRLLTCNGLYDGQAEAAAGQVGMARSAIKAFKHAGALFRRDAGAAVFDFNAPLLGVGLDAGADVSVIRRVFDRVVE